MKINKKLQNISFIIIGSLALIGLIIGSFLDQKTTGKMGDFNNLFGILFTALGPVIMLTFGVFAGSILFFIPKREKKNIDFIIRALGVASILACALFQFKEGLDYVDFPRMQAEKSTYKVLMIVLISLLDLTMFLFSRVWVKKMDQKNMLITCITIMAIILFYAVSCEIIKYLASRPRPRVLEKNENILEFKQWYQWKPFAAFSSEYKDCKSFVSGHAANAACLITILPLVASLSRKPNNNTIQILTIFIGGLFAFVVAFSRIIAKAHWLSDVMGGILLSVGLQALIVNLTPILLNKLKKDEK